MKTSASLPRRIPVLSTEGPGSEEGLRAECCNGTHRLLSFGRTWPNEATFERPRQPTAPSVHLEVLGSSSVRSAPSSTELFTFYRHSLAQCAKLSTSGSLAELAKVFAKYLDQYAQQVLLLYISERPTGQTPHDLPTQ